MAHWRHQINKNFFLRLYYPGHTFSKFNWIEFAYLNLCNLCHWEKSMTSYLKVEWRYSFATVESGGRAKNWCYMQNFSFIAPWLQCAVSQYLLNLLCACVQRSASIFRADKSFFWFGFQSWPNLPNFEVICVENTELRSKNLFLHINKETLALSHLR